MLENRKSKSKLILLPRGTFKTCIATIAFPIQLLVQNPNLRIAIDNEVYTNSQSYLGEIKKHFEQNQEFRAVYGDYVSKKGWLEERITVSKRKKIYKEPSIDIMSVDTTKVGQHYDVIICDDLVSDKNMGSEDARNKVISHYKLLLSLLEPGGLLVVIGTRWHWADLYQYIIDEDKGATDDDYRFEVYIESAVNSDGSLFFPQRLTRAFLDDKRRRQGTYIFQCQYLNRPTNKDDAFFKNVNYYKNWDNVPKELYIAVTVDPAIGMKQTNDFFAITVCGIDKFNNYWVLEYIREHLKPYDAIKRMLAIRQKWHPHVFGIETNNFQKIYKWELERIESKAGVLLPVIEIEHYKQSKAMRIMALQPYFEQGKIFIHENMVELEEQIFTFPKCRHDDIIDTLAMMPEIVRTPWNPDKDIDPREKEEEDKTQSADKFWIRSRKSQASHDDELGDNW